jgi:PAS domain S-box-containing protein
VSVVNAESTIWVATSTVIALASAVATAVLARRCSRLQRHARRTAQHRVAIAGLRRSGQLSAAERYWEQVRAAAAPILLTSPQGVILAASAGAVDLFGYGNEAELKLIPMERLYVNPIDRLRQLSENLREWGRIRSSEFRMRHQDGHEIAVLTTVRVVVAADGATYYEGVLTDISDLRSAVEERQRLESQLHLARKLELVGKLASGIAHEINTPMQFVGDNINFLQRSFERLCSQLPRDARQTELLADVADAFEGSLEGVKRVSETVRAMKEFAHPGDVEIGATDLNQALGTTLVVARNEYKHAADVKLELGDIPPVDCRRAEINKVFLNLIVNAAHAIEAKGPGKRGTITIRTSSNGARVWVDIADTGCGIPPAVLPRIFDPFFTTKAVGKGSGQGLAIARQVVVSHGGELTVQSKVGQGTTFTLALPVARDAGTLAQAPAASVAGLADSIG